MDSTTTLTDLTTFIAVEVVRRQRRRRPPPWQESMVDGLFIYIPPILIVAGTLGNFMSFLIMRSKEFRSTPSSFIYSVLAITDTAVLYTGLLRYWMIEVWEYDPRLDSDSACRTQLFITYLLGHLSACYLMLLTIERVISVYFPMQCKVLCSKKRMIIAVIISTLVEIGFNMQFFFNYELHTFYGRWRLCINSVRSFENTWSWIDSSLSSFIPFTTIFVGNMMIVLKLYFAQKAKKKMTQQSNVKGTSSTTIVLIVVCFCFLILTLPSCVYFLGISLWPRKYAAFFYRMTMLLYYLNNTINFALYFVTGARFRKAFIEMLFGKRFTKRTTDGESTKVMSISNVTMTDKV